MNDDQQSTLEERLLRYRQAKSRQIEQTSRAEAPTKLQVIQSFLKSLIPHGSSPNQPNRQRKSTNMTTSDDEIISIPEEEEEKTEFKWNRIFIIKSILVFLLWLSLFLIFIRLEFGAVFFIISFLVAIYLNTGRRLPGTKSAYSVFNPNVERIHGQITAEQLQQNLLHPFG